MSPGTAPPPARPFTLPDGRAGRVRPVTEADVRRTRDVTEAVAREERFILLEPDEVRDERAQLAHVRGIDWSTNPMWVADVDGEGVVGLADARRGTHAKVRHLAGLGMIVAPGFRGLGIGGHFMRALDAWARTVGVLKLELEVFATNARAMHVYERAGFRVEGVRARQVRVGDAFVDEIVMGKWVGERVE